MNSSDFFLYIDPGTGSMLFSILIGAAATLFFLFKALIIKIKILISGKKGAIQTDSSYSDYAIYNEGKQYFNVFYPVLDEFEKRKIPLTYLTSVKDDPAKDKAYQFVKIQYIGEGNAAFAKLNLLSAGILLMTTPSLNVYQLKRSKNVKHYSHILHAASDATMYKLFGLDFFDSVLLTGDYQKKDIRFLEEKRGIKQKTLVTVGCTYLDSLKQKIDSIPQKENKNFTVLISPSWGKSSLLYKYGENLIKPLSETSWTIIIRPHPQSKKSEPEVIEKLTKEFACKPNIKWDYENDNIYSLKEADIMISDFSGIIYDFMFLCDKPVLYVNAELDLTPYDAWDIDGGKSIWQFKTLKETAIELKSEDFTNIKDIITNASKNPELQQKRLEAKKQAWMFQGRAQENVADFMIETLSQKSN